MEEMKTQAVFLAQVERFLSELGEKWSWRLE